MSFLSRFKKTALDLGSPDGVAPAEAPAAPTESVVHHCPFCGSRGLTGGSDGSVQCGFCSKVFKVSLQPTHPSMPQTVDGQPYDAPGNGGPEDTVPVDGPVAPTPLTPEAPASGAGGGIEKFRVDAPAPAAGASSSRVEQFRTANGTPLGREDYIRHLAIVHADDREEVLMQVRSSRG